MLVYVGHRDESGLLRVTVNGDPLHGEFDCGNHGEGARRLAEAITRSLFSPHEVETFLPGAMSVVAALPPSHWAITSEDVRSIAGWFKNRLPVFIEQNKTFFVPRDLDAKQQERIVASDAICRD